MTDNITLPRAAEQVRNFLHHLRKWDVLSIPNSDGAFWCREIDAALAALDAALAEPEHIHTCGPDCQKPLCVNRRREIAAAVEAEREACAKVCEAEYEGYDWADREKDATEDCARAIRARGSK